MTWDNVADVASIVCLLGGAALAFAAGVGVLRFPDLLSRMHAGTKPQVLGLVLVLIGLSLRLRDGSAVWALVLVAAFQMLTAPVGAHLVGRAGYRTGKVRYDLLVVDELADTQDRAMAKVVAAHEAGELDLSGIPLGTVTLPGREPSAASGPGQGSGADPASDAEVGPDTPGDDGPAGVAAPDGPEGDGDQAGGPGPSGKGPSSEQE